MTSTTTTSESVFSSLEDSDDGTAVSVILKLRGETCDIDCLYCYEKRKEAPGGARIDVENIGRLTTLFRGRPLAVELHGGEPLTAGKAYLGDVLAELARQESVVRVSLQTNGVRLDNSWLDLFDSVYPDLRIGISLDGDPEGNAWRVGYDGSPTYPRVAAALELLALRRRRVGIITAVTPRVLGRAEQVLDHLAGFGAVNAISFVPCFDAPVVKATASAGRRDTASRIAQRASISAAGPAWAITPSDYADFVLSAAVHWVRSGAHSRIKLEPVVSTIRRLKGLDTSFCHFSNLKCDHVFTLYPGNRFGSCDELPWPSAGLANIDQLSSETDLISAQHRSPILSQGHSLTAKCTDCRYRDTCGGGCIATRLRALESVGSDAEYCTYRMRLIDGVAALIAQPSDVEAVFCRHVRSRPRSPNTMPDVAACLRNWDDPEAVRNQPRLATSAHGNINAVGGVGVQEAADLDPRNPAWRAAIEPGVWPLVDLLTSGWGVVTYDSCEGHAYTGLALAPTERRVGILPRSPEEYRAVAAALCRGIAAAESSIPEEVRVVIGRAELTCTATGRGFPVLDIAFEIVEGHQYTAYFKSLDAATRVLVDHLRVPPGKTDHCGCANSSEGGCTS